VNSTAQACRTHPWCTGEHANGAGIPLHRSAVIRVGPQPRHRGRGQVTVWLEAGGDGPVWLAVQAAHMASVTVELGQGDGQQLAAAITTLLVLASQP
jgi:hypothetical protein